MRRLTLVLLLAGACGSSSSHAPSNPPPVSNASSRGSGAGDVALRVEAVAGGHALIVDNQRDAALRLRREILVEHDAGGRWEPVDASSLYLRDNCEVASGAI